MKDQKICIIGDGLAGLMTAMILSKENVKVDLYCNNNKKKNKNLDNRTTAISESSYQFIKNNIKIKNQFFFWPCKKINLFFEDKKKNYKFFKF